MSVLHILYMYKYPHILYMYPHILYMYSICDTDMWYCIHMVHVHKHVYVHVHVHVSTCTVYVPFNIF